MATFGRLSNSLVSAAQENTVALANFNFDFSLLKYEAPKEYEGLGASLSKRRRDEAEDGMVHITARKLGALFETEIPQVPALIEAYGRRASEISAIPSVNPKETKAYGAFAEYVGADGTTIWATATSGQGVITMHLLACMLARIWDRAEAISVWSELVDQRKAVLARRVATSPNFAVSDIAASRVDLSRDQLAHWDASARAWLRSADHAKKVSQTNLRLVLDSMKESLPVSRNPDVYVSVIRAWTRAMLVVNDLILGRPQRVQDGDVLLGLSSWHLYPDMSVVGEHFTRTHHIAQNDELINSGGILTIGIRDEHDDSNTGIHWSLPLAHMRYYGDPEVATRSCSLKDSQVSFDDFRYVILGSVLSTWELHEKDLDKALRLIQILEESHDARPERFKKHPLRWLGTLSRACKEFQRSSKDEQKYRRGLIKFGNRRCADFLFPSAKHPPCFGIGAMGSLVRALCSKPGGKGELVLKFLQGWATIASVDRRLDHKAIIHYAPQGSHVGMDPSMCTSLLPSTPFRGRKRRRGETLFVGSQAYFRWHSTPDKDGQLWGNELDGVTDPAMADQSYPSIPVADRRGSGWSYPSRTNLPPGPGGRARTYEFVCGDEGLAAVFRPVAPAQQPEISRNAATVPELLQCLETGFIDVETLLDLLQEQCMTVCPEYFRSLDLLNHVEDIYSSLPGACVDLKVTACPVQFSAWAKYFPDPLQSSSTVTQDQVPPIVRAFCCIAYFETGTLTLDPQKMGRVMAISHHNSIFVANQLLDDPTKLDSSPPVRRITGNIGRPGLALLIPPERPRMSEMDFGSWRAVEHPPFTGELVDSFAATSLHLSFTGYEIAMDIGNRGARDTEVLFVETSISVYDRDRWIADLDIFKAESLWKTRTDCLHTPEQRISRDHLPQMRSVDSWTEFLDPPAGSGVVRAHGNPMARMAIATVAAQKGYAFHIVPLNGCWACVDKDVFPRGPGRFDEDVLDASISPSPNLQDVGDVDKAVDDEQSIGASTGPNFHGISDHFPMTNNRRGPAPPPPTPYPDMPMKPLFPDFRYPDLDSIPSQDEPQGEFLADIMFIC